MRTACALTLSVRCAGRPALFIHKIKYMLHLLLVLALSVNAEVAELVGGLESGHHVEVITELLLLQVLLRQVLEVPRV